MKVLSVCEFCEWCRSRSDYYFTSDDQVDMDYGCNRFALHFDTVAVGIHTNCILFSNNMGSIRFNYVKEVHMFDNVKRVGIVFDIVCIERDGIKTYRFLSD